MLNRVNIHAAKYHNKDKIGHEKFETDSTLMRIPAGTRIQKEQNEKEKAALAAIQEKLAPPPAPKPAPKPAKSAVKKESPKQEEKPVAKPAP